MIQCTCNKFTHEEVKSQWDRLQQLTALEFEKKIGPIIGHVSDGDSRRRKWMIQRGKSKEQERYQPLLVEEGFVVTCMKDHLGSGAIIRGITDMDMIHNHEMFICQINHATKILWRFLRPYE